MKKIQYLMLFLTLTSMQINGAAGTNDDLFEFSMDFDVDNGDMMLDTTNALDNEDIPTKLGDVSDDVINQIIQNNDKENIKTLLYALDQKDYQLMLYLLNVTNPNYLISNLSLLHMAVKNHDDIAIDLLLRYYANPNFANTNGVTPFMIAVFQGNVDVIKKLLEYGGNPSIQDVHQLDAFDYAFNKPEVLELLQSQKLSPKTIGFNFSSNNLQKNSSSLKQK